MTDDELEARLEAAREDIARAIGGYLGVLADENTAGMVLAKWVVCAVQSGWDGDGDPASAYTRIHPPGHTLSSSDTLGLFEYFRHQTKHEMTHGADDG